MATTGDRRRSPLADHNEEVLLEDSVDERYEEEEPESYSTCQALDSDTASISFGALVKAQTSFDKKNGGHDVVKYASSYDSMVKRKVPGKTTNDEALERRAGKKNTRDILRTSKHAPAELSSKKAVSRKREAVPSQTRSHGDPRFEPCSGAIDEERVKKCYSFLDSYRDSEILELKLAIRKTPDSRGKEKLKRALLSMESRKEAQKVKEQQQEVLRKHRKDEKEKIEHGKRPFYLKKADQKKRALIGRFESIKGKQLSKVIERRWKKRSAKERRGLLRRVVG